MSMVVLLGSCTLASLLVKEVAEADRSASNAVAITVIAFTFLGMIVVLSAYAASRSLTLADRRAAPSDILLTLCVLTGELDTRHSEWFKLDFRRRVSGRLEWIARSFEHLPAQHMYAGDPLARKANQEWSGGVAARYRGMKQLGPAEFDRLLAEVASDYSLVLIDAWHEIPCSKVATPPEGSTKKSRMVAILLAAICLLGATGLAASGIGTVALPATVVLIVVGIAALARADLAADLWSEVKQGVELVKSLRP
ncbi:hypothetical protein ACI8AA_06955 [Geodermatophilus sp. SYSU D01180]